MLCAKLNIATINSRIFDLISATDDATKDSALKFLEDVKKGKTGVIASNEFLSGVTTQPYGTTGHGTITDLIELMQYQKAIWFNELGLNANYNMKRESLNSSESQLNNDALLPLIDDMLKNRQIFAEKVNAMFGTNISVELASSWEDNLIELENEQALTESEIEQNEPTVDETETVTEEPETVTEEPETVTEEPETVTEEPETVTEEPEIPVEVIVTTEVDVKPVEETEQDNEPEESEGSENEEQTDDK